MKLKKILSLALSGILAVSMLAACGGGNGVSGLFDTNDQSGSFASTLNSKLSDNTKEAITFDNKDSKLKSVVRDVAKTVTEDQANKATGDATSEITTTVQTLTGYGALSTGDKWDVASKSGTYVKVYVYNANNDSYNTLDEVATLIKNDIEKINLHDAMTGTAHTNSYKGSVAAYKVAIPTASSDSGAKDAAAWVIAVAIEQTATAVK